MSAPDIVAMLHEWCEEDHTDHDNCIHCVAANEIDRLRAIKASDDGAYEHVVEMYHAEHAEVSRLRDETVDIRIEVLRLREECKAWMNGVADAVEHLGFDREAACGPADLLPGLKWLVERTDDCDDDCVHAPMCRKWRTTCPICNDTGHLDDDAGQVPCPACVGPDGWAETRINPADCDRADRCPSCGGTGYVQDTYDPYDSIPCPAGCEDAT